MPTESSPYPISVILIRITEALTQNHVLSLPGPSGPARPQIAMVQPPSPAHSAAIAARLAVAESSVMASRSDAADFSRAGGRR